MNNDYDLIPEIDLNKYEELEVTLESPVDGTAKDFFYNISEQKDAIPLGWLMNVH